MRGTEELPPLELLCDLVRPHRHRDNRLLQIRVDQRFVAVHHWVLKATAKENAHLILHYLAFSSGNILNSISIALRNLDNREHVDDTHESR